MVHHRGRVSGRQHGTPVWAFRADDGFVIALTYGADSDWVRNVVEAGGCALRRGGRLLGLTRPRIVTGPEGRTLVPRIVRGPLGAMNVTEFLSLSVG